MDWEPSTTDISLFSPFLMRALMSLPMTEDRSIDTMATDGRCMFYNPEWVATLGRPEINGVRVHEALHVLLGHHVRQGSRDHARWNMACVSVDSLILMADGSEKCAGDVIPGEHLWSPCGPSMVYRVLDRGIKPVLRLDSSYGTSYVTYDHKFLRDGGWIAATEGSGSYKDFHGVPASARFYLGELQDHVSPGHERSHRRGVSQCRSVRGEATTYGGSIHRQTQARRNLRAAHRFADSVYSGVRGRRRNDQHREKRRVLSASRDHSQYFNTDRGMAAMLGFFSGGLHKSTKSRVLESLMEWIRAKPVAGAHDPLSGNQKAQCRTPSGVYLNTSRAVQEAGSNGAYARYCKYGNLAKRTRVVAYREDTPRQVVDFVTEHHVFVVGGLVSHNCDYEINPYVMDSGYSLPPDALFKQEFDGLSAEQIYDLLGDNASPAPAWGIVLAEANATDIEKLKDEWRKLAASAQWGHLPKNLARSLGAQIEAGPSLIQRVSHWFSGFKQGHIETWAPPSRRCAFLPSLEDAPSGYLVACIDTSGSMGADELTRCISALAGLADVDRLDVIAGDADVSGVWEDVGVSCQMSDIAKQIEGGGGTDFRPLLARAMQGAPDGIVYFTDGRGEYGDKPGVPVLWAMTEKQITPPWGDHFVMER